MPTCEAFLRDSSIFEVDNIKTAAIPRDVKIFQLGNIKKYHTCHAKPRLMSPSATRATPKWRCVWASCVWASCVWGSCLWVSCVWTSCEWVSCVWLSCVWVSCVWTSCVWASCVWEGDGCRCHQELCVTELRVSELCVREGVVCVWGSCELCVRELCVSQVCVWEGDGGRAQPKTRSPHQDVGKNLTCNNLRSSDLFTRRVKATGSECCFGMSYLCVI